MPSVRCRGNRILTAVWRGALRDDPALKDIYEAINKLLSLNSKSSYSPTMSSEALFMERYSFNAEALLMIKCSVCDESNHVFYSHRNSCRALAQFR